MLNWKHEFCILRGAELGCWTAGLVLTGAFLGHSVLAEVHRQQGIADMADTPAPTLSTALSVSRAPDQSLWSSSRIAAWRASAPQPPLAVLEIPSLGLEVPVFQGDMERGPAWIKGTARPGQPGNTGISGHRDGYFRALKDAGLGDSLSLRTAGRVQRYVVDDIRIVDPLDVEVLDPTDTQTLTLVTCYPFYFIGSAPQRYIVRARLDESVATAAIGDYQKEL